MVTFESKIIKYTVIAFDGGIAGYIEKSINPVEWVFYSTGSYSFKQESIKAINQKLKELNNANI